MMQIVECVPNISEGRDRAKIDAIVAAAAKVPGVQVLDVDAGADTNRTVITFAGVPEAVCEGAYQLIAKAAELIDMQTHKGAHARMGATDVCPFIPVSNVTMDECVALARTLGERVGRELKIPVYLYESAAASPARKSLSDIRHGEYEGLAAKLKHQDWAPDFGTRDFNPKSGATVIGARPFLIAYNVNLNTRSKKLATIIAERIREQGGKKRDGEGNIIKGPNGETTPTPGKFQSCKAVGWYIAEYGCAQVSINLTDYTVTNMHQVLEACEEEARSLGLRVTGSEIVGLVPKAALLQSGRYYLVKQCNFSSVSERELIHTAIRSLGLSDVKPFDPRERIIEERLRQPTPLADMTIADFADELASDSVAPGGGSVAALAGALSGALSAMVCALSYPKANLKAHRPKFLELGEKAQQLKVACLKAIDDDTKSFDGVIAAMRAVPKAAPKDAPEQLAVSEAYKHAAAVPLTVAQNAVASMQIASEVISLGLESATSDVATAGAMAEAALRGASYNVRINLKEIRDAKWVADVRNRLMALESQAQQLGQSLAVVVEQRLGG